MVGADGTKTFNATQFAFGDLATNAISESNIPMNHQASYYDVFTGDFDGNGMTDLMVAYISTYYTVRYHDFYRVFLNGSQNWTYEYNPQGITTGLYYCTDVTGDGRDDIVIAQLDLDVYADAPYSWWQGGAGAWRFKSIQVLNSTSTMFDAEFVVNSAVDIPWSQTYIKQPTGFMEFWDYDANGKTDIIVMCDDINNSNNAFAYLFTDGAWTQLDISATMWAFARKGKSFVGNCDGDGKADLLILEKGPVCHYYGLGVNSEHEVYTIVADNLLWCSSLTECEAYAGDFNGDGITDFLARNLDGPQTWQLHTGVVPSDPAGEHFIHGSTMNLSAGSKILIGDFDGNGMDDIARYYYDEGARFQVP
ncbi:MAG TPA: VCBS repeat-containing protein, partial [Flavobacteriales bacterium]|nr:VCBS repeat-containing protein [Flavobacteriales bacterium]